MTVARGARFLAFVAVEAAIELAHPHLRAGCIPMAQEEVLHQTPSRLLLAKEMRAGSRDLVTEPPRPVRVPGHDRGQGRAAGRQQGGRGGGHAVEHRLAHVGLASEKAVGKQFAGREEPDVFERMMVDWACGDGRLLSIDRDGDDTRKHEAVVFAPRACQRRQPLVSAKPLDLAGTQELIELGLGQVGEDRQGAK